MAQTEQPRYDELADADLLGRFLKQRDEAAFAAIVRRHHGLVYGVCRRRLRCVHDAEDAFQATFLVLAQRAHKIASCDALASWLYGVAYRVALRLARQRAAVAEATLEEAPMVHDDPWQILAARHEQLVTDEELAALPEKLRAPVVLRYLTGKTNEEVAADLSITVAAVEGRLKRAKARLRGRLVRRGIALGTTLAPLGAAKYAGAQAAGPLVAQTVAACLGGSSAAIAASGAATSATATSAADTAIALKTSHTALQLATKEILAMTTLKFSNVAAIATVLVCTTTVGWGLREAFSQPGGNSRSDVLVLNQQNASGDDDPFNADPNVVGVAAQPGDITADVAAGAAGGMGFVGGGRTSAPTNNDLSGAFDMKGTSDTQLKIRSALAGPVDLQYIDQPLNEVIDDLSSRYDMHIELDRPALETLGVDASTPVNANYRGLSFRSALQLMLERLELTYVIEDEYLLITTPEEADQLLDTRIYPIRPQWRVNANDLIAAMTATIDQNTWDTNGGPGNVKPLGQNLVITQTQEVHEGIVDLLMQLERAAEFRVAQGYDDAAAATAHAGGDGGMGTASASAGYGGSGYEGGYGGGYSGGYGAAAGESGFGHGIGGGYDGGNGARAGGYGAAERGSPHSGGTSGPGSGGGGGSGTPTGAGAPAGGGEGTSGGNRIGSP